MAKKTRRVRRKGTPPRLSETQLARPSQKAIIETPSVQEEERSEPTDFRQEYQYVIKDLQRIGLLAAAMLGGLILLSLVL
jgi:hypothetical protein